MKKLISIVLVLCFALVLVSCGKKDPSPIETSSGVSAEGFVKPDTYASVLLVTINPQFRLYLDEDGKVLAVEAVNKDAESIRGSITFENHSFEAVVENIITAANQNGFLKEDATVSFEIVESKETDKAQIALLALAEKAADDTADALAIDVKISLGEIAPSDGTEPTETVPNETQGATEPTDPPAETKPSGTQSTTKPVHKHSYAAATCTEPKKCTCGATQGSALGHDYKDGVCARCGAKDPDYQPPHTHSYAAATCTEPKKCSCGATQGSALGHDYKDGVCARCGAKDPNYQPPHTHSYSAATCTEPKKCACGATQGSALGHDYKDGVCARCGAKDPNYVPPTPVLSKQGEWMFAYLQEGELYSVTVIIGDSHAGYFSVGIGVPLSSLPSEMQDSVKDYCTEYNGKLYYIGMGDGDGITVTEEGSTVTLTDSSGNTLVLTRTGENTLRCDSAPSSFANCAAIPVGAEFTFAEHDYENGVCARCGAKDPNYVPPTPVLSKQGEWTFGYLQENTLYSVSLVICMPGKNLADVGIGDPVSSLPPDMQNDPQLKDFCTEYNGNLYYIGMGDSDSITATEEGNTVILTDSSGNMLILARTGENTMRCDSAPSVFAKIAKIPIGAEFTFVESKNEDSAES